MTRARRTPEGLVLQQIEDYLRCCPAVRWWRNSPGRLRGYTVARRGSPDIEGYVVGSGVYWACEIKAAKGKLSPDQERYLAQLRLDNVPCGVVRCVEDAAAIVGEAVGRAAP